MADQTLVEESDDDGNAEEEVIEDHVENQEEGQLNEASEDSAEINDEADQIADQIVASNIRAQQQESQQQEQESGTYDTAGQATLLAYMNYLPGFTSYTDMAIPAIIYTIWVSAICFVWIMATLCLDLKKTRSNTGMVLERVCP